MPYALALLVALLGLSFTSRAAEPMDGYQWSQVADGIFLHSATDPLAGPVDGNTVIVDYGDGVLVVDTHINPAAARNVIALVRDEIDKPVTHVVNTHWHDDHTNGNHAFRDAYPTAKIIAHRATLDALKRGWRPMEEQRMAAYATQDAAQILAAADDLDDPYEAMGYRIYAAYLEALKPELPSMEFVYPDTVIDDSFILPMTDRRIEVQWLGRANTAGDVVILLPDDDILISGDILVWPIPFAFDSPMLEWVDTLQSLSELGFGRIIPGHGPVLEGGAYLQQVSQLLTTTLNKVQAAHDGGATLENLPEHVDLGDLELRFTDDIGERTFAWRSYFIGPGLKSAWDALGYPVPED